MYVCIVNNEEVIVEQVKSLLRDRGFKTIAEFADSMGKTSSTFLNSLKYFSQNQGYNTKFAIDLFNALNITEEEFKVLLEQPQQQTRDTRYLRIIDQMAEGYQHPQDFRIAINRLLEVLQSGDRVILSTSTNPAEFTSINRQQIIAGAIDRGVRFSYIYPQADHKATAAIYQQYIGQFSNEWKYMQEAHQGFVRDMTRLFPPREPEAHKKVQALLPVYYAQAGPLINPFHSYLIIQINRFGDPESFVLESAMAAMPGSEENDFSIHWYPLPAYLAHKLAESALEIAS